MSVPAIDNAARAERIWIKIQRNKLPIVFTKPKVVTKTGTTPETALPAQMVRVTSDSRATVVGGVAGTAPKHALVVFGVKGHPDPAVTDTDIDEGYTFPYDGETYRVNKVIPVPGGVQAIATTGGAA